MRAADRLAADARTVTEIAAGAPAAERRLHAASASLQRLAKDPRLDASRVCASLRGAADDLLARGVVRMAYALAIGQPNALPLDINDLSGRHEFRLPDGRLVAWVVPSSGSGPSNVWHVTGSLLGLDSALASLSLVRVSAAPPSRRPSLADADRRVFVEAVALVNPTSLTDGDRDAIVSALKRGRARVAAAQTAADLDALAADVRLSPARRSLLGWVAAHDPGRVSSFLSLTEIAWAGLAHEPELAGLQRWGAPAGPRLGCLCTQFMEPRPLDAFDNRWGTGLVASGFSDLNLRLAELLSELQMPASLLGSVLASATLEFVEGVVSRDPDDRRGLLEYVLALQRDRVEQYLATLTTDGPLVPVTDVGGSSRVPR